MLTGPNWRALEEVLAACPCGVIASGGVSCAEDVARLAALVVPRADEPLLSLALKSAEEALDPESKVYSRWTLHGVSHMLGMDVHDCGQAAPEAYAKGTYAEGMVLTVEPGLYFQPDDLLVPEEYRGIGVRIEDDVVVTKDGVRNLSAHLPRHPDEIERWIATLQH